MKEKRVKFGAVFLAAVVVLFSGVAVFGQSNLWQKQGVKPTGIDLNNVFFLNANEGWAVGYSGLIIHTADGGQTWEIQRLADSSEVLWTVFFKDSLHGWVGGQNMLYTTDGGRTWQQSNCGGICLSQVWHFLDDNRGFGTDYAGLQASANIVRTTDGGRNWTRQSFPIPISTIKFFDQQNGIAYHNQIMRTTDGGGSWTLQPGTTQNGLSASGTAALFSSISTARGASTIRLLRAA